MKMSPEDFDTLAAAIAPLDTEATRAAYRERRFPRADRVRDLDRRYRWDLACAAVGSGWVCGQYDQGLTDAHVDTALRRIVRPL